MGEFNAKDANFLWRQIGRIDGVIETLNRTEGEMPEIIAGVLEMQGVHTFVSKNPIRFSDGSVSNHHVLDKFGWAWRDPKYKSETELCAMLKRAKEKGLTIEELSI